MSDLILALDTSTPRAYVAVVRLGSTGEADAVVELQSSGRNSHHEELARLTDEALTGLGVGVRALSQVVIGAGPGSFTGLRIGYSFARGLALSVGISMRGVSSLLGAAWEFRSGGSPIVAVLDAGRGEVFSAIYQPTPSGLVSVRPPGLVHQSALSGYVEAAIGQTKALFVALGEADGDGYVSPSRTATGLVGAFLAERPTGVRSIDSEPEYLRPVAARTIRDREGIKVTGGLS